MYFKENEHFLQKNHACPSWIFDISKFQTLTSVKIIFCPNVKKQHYFGIPMCPLIIHINLYESRCIFGSFMAISHIRWITKKKDNLKYSTLIQRHKWSNISRICPEFCLRVKMCQKMEKNLKNGKKVEILKFWIFKWIFSGSNQKSVFFWGA